MRTLLALLWAELVLGATIRFPGCAVSTITGFPAGWPASASGFPFLPAVGGNQDGATMAASFTLPIGVAVNSSGFIYVLDRLNFALRVVSPGLAVTTSRVLASTPTGLYGGTVNVEGEFDAPNAIAMINNVVYLATNRSLWAYDPAGPLQRGAMLAGGENIFTFAVGLAADTSRPNVLYVAMMPSASDQGGGIYSVSVLPGSVQSGLVLLAGSVSRASIPAGTRNAFDGQGDAAMFGSLAGIQYDAFNGRLLVADFGAHIIRAVSLPGGVVSTVVGDVTRSLSGGSSGGFNPAAGNADGLPAAATFNSPDSIALVGPNTFLVSDFGNNGIRLVSLAAGGGGVVTVAGTEVINNQGGWADGPGEIAYVNPMGMAVAPDGTVIVADGPTNTIRRLRCDFLAPSPLPPPPAAADNVLGPVVVGNLRSGALAIIIAAAVVVLALVGAVGTWALRRKGSSAGASPPSTPTAAAYSTLNPSSPTVIEMSKAAGGEGPVLNPLAVNGSAEVPLPGGVVEWNAKAPL